MLKSRHRFPPQSFKESNFPQNKGYFSAIFCVWNATLFAIFYTSSSSRLPFYPKFFSASALHLCPGHDHDRRWSSIYLPVSGFVSASKSTAILYFSSVSSNISYSTNCIVFPRYSLSLTFLLRHVDISITNFQGRWPMRNNQHCFIGHLAQIR